jgi:tRNA threonylcarbamoyladenosine biosynthesis protein TsaE
MGFTLAKIIVRSGQKTIPESYLYAMEFSYDLKGIQSSAKAFWRQFSPFRIFAFHGPIGAGKTTFIQALCAVKGVDDTVGSPTFPIINEYRYPKGKIFHIDLYRLKDEQEALDAGVEDSLYSGEICLVEWPERAPRLFPPDTVNVYIEVLDPFIRKIAIPDSI